MPLPPRRIPGPDRRAEWGYFEPEDGRVFRVTSTDTPRPWINLLGNGEYGAFFSQHGLGYSFYRSPKSCEVTRWSLNESRPRWFDAGRLVFVKDLDTGDYWIGNPQPGEGANYESYYCRHTPGWSEIVAARNGIEFAFRFFIPVRGACELWSVTLRNATRRARRLALVPFVELPTRSTYYQARGRYDKRLRAVRCAHPGDPMWQRLDTHFFFGLDRAVTAWETSREDFLGVRDDPRRPLALERGLGCGNADTEWMVAALETRLTLKPGETATVTGILGYAIKDSEAAAMLRRYRHPGAVAKAFREVTSQWDSRLARGACSLPDADVARFLSVWGKNAMAQVTRGSRAKTIGYRDTAQDLRGYLLIDPLYVRPKLLWLLAHVHRDGRVYRSIDPWGERHDKDDFRDNPVWMAELVNAYLKETGDLALLNEEIPYYDGGEGTVWEHLVTICRRLVKLRGAHHLVLVGGGDWNDALGPFGIRGKGESAWLSLLLVRALRLLAEIAHATGRAAEGRRLLRWRAALAEAFNRHAWDGAWYVYGWDDDGRTIGSRRSPEGKIHANVQTWALMERVAPPEREPLVWDAIERYLDIDSGILTCWPPYVKSQPSGARIAKLNPGWIENGAAYCHGTAFYMAACLAAGKGEKACEALRTYLPTNPRNPRCDMEPYGVTNFYVGPGSRHFGRAGYSWFTGSVSWFLCCGWDGLLGLQPEFAGLRIAPCVPPSWRRWSATRVFRGATYCCDFSKPAGSRGVRVKRLLVDGREIAGDIIAPFAGGRHRVQVELE